MIFRSMTPQEANVFLPLLKEHFSKIHGLVTEGQMLHEKILGRSAQHDASGGVQISQDITPLKTKLEDIEQRIRNEMLEVSQYGAIIKSVFPARIDFRSERHKQPVYLCWQTGDSHVSHWHPIEEGFQTRRFIHEPQEFGPTVVH